jgi:hypothetical protein
MLVLFKGMSTIYRYFNELTIQITDTTKHIVFTCLKSDRSKLIVSNTVNLIAGLYTKR